MLAVLDKANINGNSFSPPFTIYVIFVIIIMKGEYIMPIDNMIVKEVEFNGKKIKQLFVIINKEEYLLGTIKKITFNDNELRYINCVHKEFKK